MSYNLKEIKEINKNLIELKRLNKTFPFLISKLLSDNLDISTKIINENTNENEVHNGIQSLYLREIRLGEMKNIQLDIETIGLLKILIK